ncbi:hypothetical protein VCUG_02124 [Vavraia culicis subsp. floridensis]|uniref:Uncharacterized protein n=1 Tax=Vavraia culicis (isolate floridensis) TaxID=948595 RepID=L2GST3_VAVCU|nr:uncharacterized protein VCUG_02124 [Vavraia culicis subsp. floridensis]ELA46402.1 hypothetical protein VCUG_02124 [Vavraia culicis subsp. floridensis]
MDEHVQSFRLQHKALIKQFYITSSTQNLEKLYQNALNSKDDEIVEEFIKLCCISVDRTKFKNYLTNIIEHFVWLGLKYYDEMDGYDEARTIIENEVKRLRMIIRTDDQL